MRAFTRPHLFGALEKRERINGAAFTTRRELLDNIILFASRLLALVGNLSGHLRKFTG